MIIVRPATGEDIPWLLDQLQAFDGFVAAAYPLFPDLDAARSRLDFLITQHVFLVSENEGELTGFIAGLLAPHFFNPAIKQLSELLWWVAMEHRGSRAGLLLLNAFIELGEREANWIVMTLEEKSPVREETLLKRGFKPFERNYLIEVAA